MPTNFVVRILHDYDAGGIDPLNMCEYTCEEDGSNIRRNVRTYTLFKVQDNVEDYLEKIHGLKILRRFLGKQLKQKKERIVTKGIFGAFPGLIPSQMPKIFHPRN